MDRSKYEAIFDQEAQRYLNELEALLIGVEKAPSDRERWGEIHGKIHSIKGMAKALSMDRIASLGHLMESWCKLYQQGRADASERALQTLFEGTDLLRHLVVQKGRITSAESQQRFSRMTVLLEKPPEKAVRRGDPAGRSPEILHSVKARPINEVRVKYALIEELLGLSQEIQLLEKTLPPLAAGQAASGLKSWLDHAVSLMKMIHFRLAHLRLMPVGDFADLYAKTIRDLAREYGKQVEVEIVGGEIQADITLLERLREPLVHLFRNCIAHGIEPPEARKRAGKDPVGKIRIEAIREKERLLVKIADDGKGIDRAAIVAHLRKNRGLSAAEIDGFKETELFHTILDPDYSSSAVTDDLSGRGIGMSVVAQAIAYLGGTMRIASVPHQGTEFFIRLPLSLSIVHAVTFRLDRYRLSIPTSQIAAVDRMENRSLEPEHRMIDLKRTLGITNGHCRSTNLIRLKIPGGATEAADCSCVPAFGVDGIVGNRPLMVMPVGELAARAKVFTGVGIMENGDVSMVLDVQQILAEAAKEVCE